MTQESSAGLAGTELPRFSVGVVNYHAYEELDRCLSSLKAQSLHPERVAVFDADSHPEALDELIARHSEVQVESGPNLGFAAGANYLLSLIHDPELDFVLILNSDVDLSADFCDRLFREMAERPDVALGGGKLLRPCGQVIDSAGIELPRNRRPRDRGSEEIDRGQFDQTETVFGVSGAALGIRCDAMPELAIGGEIFDEDFFMYHEDTDLAWRAGELGWRSLYVHDAVAIHQRTWRPGLRFEIAPIIRRHSFKNHYLQIVKNERASRFLRDLPVILFWEFARLGFAVLRDRSLLRGYREALRLLPGALGKRRAIRTAVRNSQRS